MKPNSAKCPTISREPIPSWWQYISKADYAQGASLSSIQISKWAALSKHNFFPFSRSEGNFMIITSHIDQKPSESYSAFLRKFRAEEPALRKLVAKWKKIVPSDLNFQFIKDVFFQCKAKSNKCFYLSTEKMFPLLYLAACQRFGLYFSLSVLNLIPASRQLYNKIYLLVDFLKIDYFQLVMQWVMKIAEEAQSQRPNKPILDTLYQYLDAANFHQKKIPLKQLPHRPLTVAIVFLQIILESRRIYLTYSKILQAINISALPSIETAVKKKIRRYIWQQK
jgi:hypothetical protein